MKTVRKTLAYSLKSILPLSRYTGIINDGITALLVILWGYVAVDKLLNYEMFTIQLGKSPMLTEFTGLIASAIPAIELALALLLAISLFISRTRLWGYYMSLFLMVMFTTYIIIILNYSYYVPCSCGGVLEKLTWTQHIYFNLLFVMMTITGILIEEKVKEHPFRSN